MLTRREYNLLSHQRIVKCDVLNNSWSNVFLGPVRFATQNNVPLGIVSETHTDNRNRIPLVSANKPAILSQ
jgi:hypothetical protein